MIRWILAILAIFPLRADACPPSIRHSPPPPVVYYQPCPPPGYVFYPPCYRGPSCCWNRHPPVQYVRIVEAAPVEIAKDKDEAPDGWCHIRGRIIWDKAAGDAPVRQPIKATKDQNVALMD